MQEVLIRQAIERRIVNHMIDELCRKGYYLQVDNGGDEIEVEPKIPSNDPIELKKLIMLTDEDYLYVHTTPELTPYYLPQRIGWARFIYGNDGWDVINDYSVNLEKKGMITDTLKLVDDIENGKLWEE